MSKVIGRDVTVYSLQASGQDGNPQSGTVSSMLGRWESIDITITNEWATVTSSDATQPEKVGRSKRSLNALALVSFECSPCRPRPTVKRHSSMGSATSNISLLPEKRSFLTGAGTTAQAWNT